MVRFLTLSGGPRRAGGRPFLQSCCSRRLQRLRAPSRRRLPPANHRDIGRRRHLTPSSRPNICCRREMSADFRLDTCCRRELSADIRPDTCDTPLRAAAAVAHPERPASYRVFSVSCPRLDPRQVNLATPPAARRTGRRRRRGLRCDRDRVGVEAAMEHSGISVRCSILFGSTLRIPS